jgi:hypothetical protein
VVYRQLENTSNPDLTRFYHGVILSIKYIGTIVCWSGAYRNVIIKFGHSSKTTSLFSITAFNLCFCPSYLTENQQLCFG